MQRDTHDRRTIDDQWFKELVHDGHVLAEILRVMPEFRYRSRSEILSCLGLGSDERYVKGRNTELGYRDSTPILLDSVFDVTLPGTGKGIEIIVGVEGQNYLRGDILANRQQIYSSRMILEQEKGTTKHQIYENLKRTVSIWVRLGSPPEARNRIIRDYRVRCYLDEPEQLSESPLNKMEVYEINIGGYVEGAGSPVGMLNLLFTQDLDTEVTCSKLREKYDIVLDKSIIGEVKSMGALADEYEYLMQKSFDEGEASGFIKAQAEFIEYLAGTVLNLVRTEKVDLDEAMRTAAVPPKHWEAVADKCRAILGND